MFEEKVVPYDVYNVGIDSRYRDISKFLNPYEYVISFDNIFKNVISVQLVFAVYEKNGTDLYVNLHIDELSPNLISNSNFITGSFCQLPMLQPLNSYDSGMYKCIKVFEKPLAKLSRLSIKFLNPDGSLYPMRDHFLKFEINCMKPSSGAGVWKSNEIFAPGISVFQSQNQSHTQNNQRKAEGAWDPYALLNVPNTYDVDVLKTAFKSASEVLKAQCEDKQVLKVRYKDLKEAFKHLIEKL
jgi:hypothetical protein